MTEIMQSIILGLIQGLTEFLPISSSAHLNLFPWIFNFSEISESFDVALHLGTLLAILVFFFKEWLELIKGGFEVFINFIKTHSNKKEIVNKNNKNNKNNKSNKNNKTKKTNELNNKDTSNINEKTISNGRMFWYLVLATIPAGILSIILDKISDKIIQDNLNLEMGLIAISLIVMGIILYIVDKKSESKVTYKDIDLKKSVIIGTSQAIAAAFPGVSRSGITMTVARYLKIDRESAAKFSFLLSAPIVVAAVLVNITNFTISIPFFIGILTSFISGLLVIKFLMEYLKKGSFKVFAVYRVILGLIVLGIILFR